VGVDLWLKALAGLAAAAHSQPAFGHAGWLVVSARSRAGPGWLRLFLVGGSGSYDLWLCIDQVDPQSWSRLNARLRRGSKEATPVRHGSQRTGQADLR
jgi:hypothetical protein